MLSNTSLVFLFSSLILRNKASICCTFLLNFGLSDLTLLLTDGSESVEEMELKIAESSEELLVFFTFAVKVRPEVATVAAVALLAIIVRERSSSSVSVDIVEDTASDSVPKSSWLLLKPLTTSLQPIRMDMERPRRRTW